MPIVTIAVHKAKIVVPHPISDDHYIELIWAKDQNNKIIAAVELTTLTSLVELEFDVPNGTTMITAYESCNKFVNCFVERFL